MDLTSSEGWRLESKEMHGPAKQRRPIGTRGVEELNSSGHSSRDGCESMAEGWAVCTQGEMTQERFRAQQSYQE